MAEEVEDPTKDVPGGTAAGGLSPEDDELAAKRAAASTNGNGGDGGQSIEDLTAAGGAPAGMEADGQFVWEQGKRVSLATLYGRNTPVEYTFKLEGKTLKGGAGMGLLAFSDPDRVLVVPIRAGKVEVDPSYDDDGKIKKVTIRAHAKALTAYDARTEAAAVAMAGEPSSAPAAAEG